MQIISTKSTIEFHHDGIIDIILLSEIQAVKIDNSLYLLEWKEKVKPELIRLALNEITIALILNGYFDRNKSALMSHLKRVNKAQHFKAIWSLIS